MKQENLIQPVLQKCSSCGASLDIEVSTTIIKCNYCGSTFQIIKPLKVNDSCNNSLNEESKQKYSNLAKILEKSMIANNFKEAYEYCNKLLEIDPENAEVWVNKAICSYWLTGDNKIIFSQAKEIITYLNTAKQIDSNSKILEETSKALAENLYILSRYYLYKTPQRLNTEYKIYCGGYLKTDIADMIEFIKLWDTAYQIYPDTKYLKKAVEQLTPTADAKVKWEKYIINEFKVFPVVALKNAYIEKIIKVEPVYIPPKKPSFFESFFN